jgi:phospholipase/carboxylesterase
VSLVHRIRRPAAHSHRPPLLVLLHGIGADEEDLLGLAPALDPRFLVVSPRAPHLARPMGYAWYAIDWSTRPPTVDADQAEASRELLATFVAETVARHGADPGRVFLLGFSQGAILALGLSLARPDLVRGAVAHSGRLLPVFLSGAAAPEALSGLEVLLQHGSDDDVVPVERGREARDLLAPLLGERASYREYDLGHSISEESLADAAAWLAARAGR